MSFMIVPTDLLLAGIFSFFIGILSAILGLGGGFLLVPMYTLYFGLDPVLAIGTSLSTSVFTAASASIYHARERTIQYQVVMMLIIGSVPSVIVASYLVRFLPGNVLSVFFSLILIYISIRMIASGLSISRVQRNDMPSTFSSVDADINESSLKRQRLILWGILGGIISGFSGVSAGTIFVPALFRSGSSIKAAVAASLTAIVFTSLGAALMSIMLNHVSFPFLLFSAGGVTIGALVGVRISYLLRSATIQYGFSIVLMIIAFLMLNNTFR